MSKTIYLEVEAKNVERFLDFAIRNSLKVYACGNKFEDFDGYVFVGANNLENRILEKYLSNIPMINNELEKSKLKISRVHDILNVYRVSKKS